MRIVLDLQGVQGESRIRGIGRYSLSLAEAIVRNRDAHEVHLILNGMLKDGIEPIRAAFADLLPREHIHVWHAAAPTDSVHSGNEGRRYAAEWLREAFIASLAPDVVHISSLFEGFGDDAVHSLGRSPWTVPTAVTLYDLIPLLKDSGYAHPDPAFEPFYRDRLNHLRQADRLLCISESARNEAISLLNTRPEDAVNIGAAVDDRFRPVEISAGEKADLFRRLGLSRKLVMYSGATDERKNHMRLIEAWARLPETVRSQHQLVIVGKLPDAHFNAFTDQARRFGLSGQDVVITGRVSDDDLLKLYNLCTLFVFPSLHEGFGLPVLEAMSCGAAVIASSLTSMPEIVGRQDALFDPCDVDAIAAKMQQALEDTAFRADLSESGLRRASDYSWDITAQKAIAAFEALHAAKTAGGTPTAEMVVEAAIEHFAGRADREAIAFVDLAAGLAKTYPAPAPRQLLVDISELATQDSRTGIQRVVRSILSELVARPPQGFVVRPVYAGTEVQGYRYATRFMHAFQGQSPSAEDICVEVRSGDVFLGLDLQHIVVMRQAEVYREWRRMGVEVYFVVYDLLPLVLPAFFAVEMQDAHQNWLKTLAEMDGIVAISRAVADETAEWLKANGPERHRPLKLGWFHLGADIEGSRPTTGLPPESTSVFQAMRERPTFLMVGTLEPRKGYAQVIDACDALWAEGVDANLVLVGKLGWHVGALVSQVRDHPHRHDRLFWLENASDEFLQKLYDKADALIAASEGEGFGLPLIEAARHDLAIIARDLPVFREVAGERASFFDAHDAAGLAGHLKTWLDLHAEDRAPRSSGLPWLTWAQSRDQLVEVILGGKWYKCWI
ncbi:MAG: glycosyltransferase family 4 protein [Asticcacaulis sp.]|nr:glycosyltransferase family 4 protein [Asticcacaulis sp.]